MPALVAGSDLGNTTSQRDWMAYVHPDDRLEVSRTVDAFINGVDGSGAVDFRRVVGREQYERIECELRLLHRSGDRRFFALMQIA
jgi:hypothetical protein